MSLTGRPLQSANSDGSSLGYDVTPLVISGGLEMAGAITSTGSGVNLFSGLLDVPFQLFVQQFYNLSSEDIGTAATVIFQNIQDGSPFASSSSPKKITAAGSGLFTYSGFKAACRVDVHLVVDDDNVQCRLDLQVNGTPVKSTLTPYVNSGNQQQVFFSDWVYLNNHDQISILATPVVNSGTALNTVNRDINGNSLSRITFSAFYL